MSKSERDAARVRRTDDLAAMLEAVGFPHGIARVYAALLLVEKEGMSTGELVEELGISKASVSNAMQFMVGTRLAERYRVRGSREAHYRMLKGVWGDVLARKFASISYLRETVERALEDTGSPQARERLEEMHEVFAFFETEFEQAMDHWNERMSR